MGEREITNKLAIFEAQEIRRVLIDGEWYYSIEDVVQVLTDSRDIKQYIKKLRQRDLELNSNWGTICTPLPLKARDGKRRPMLCSDTEGLFRVIQSIPSKKAEPFKRWLARVGKERLDEIEQPEKAIGRAKNYYRLKGYSPKWIETRTAGIETREEFTETLKERGVREGIHYAILTNEMYRATFDFTAQEYKNYKGLEKTDSLWDNMTPLELASTIFSEATATEFITKSDAKGFYETRDYILKAGNITNEAISKIEAETGKKVVTKRNYKHLNLPEKQKEIIRKSINELESHIENTDEELTDFDKKLTGLLNLPPEKKSKDK